MNTQDPLIGGPDPTQFFSKTFLGRPKGGKAMGSAPQRATVVGAPAATTTKDSVTITGFSETATFTANFEPRFGSGGTAQVPPAGTVCLIVFPPNDNNPWVIAFDSWPT
jgi:hypothetical protein